MRRDPALMLVAVLALALAHAQARADDTYARDPAQAVDTAYAKKIAEYTTAPQFSSPLVDYLPASDTVPTPKEVLGDVAGAPNYLPYVADVHRYFRLLESKSKRVKVFSIGTSEEGREMIAVAIADEALLADYRANGERLAQLADPRVLALDDARAAPLIAASTPVYYITGAIHSPETGSPTALMELAYRLAVDEAPYIRKIRSKVITLITPVVETDGRDRMVDLYNWHLAHPKDNIPPLIYWGHYVAHDNNRDAMGLTLKLTRNVLDTYVGWHAQVLHDLHESVPFLYDNTIGDGPYNAWVDPILTNEWQMLGWNNVQQMTQFGMPGVFAHGEFDTWSPGYLMFLAALHNGVSRLYETFGNAGADTVERILSPDEYSRTWFRQNPPQGKVLWSQRNNNNYQQTALLTTLNYFADNSQTFLRNFYLKSKRSVQKPTQGGPAAYVLPADDAHLGAQAQLLRVLRAQHVEVSRANAAFTVEVQANDAGKQGRRDQANADKKAKRAQAKGSKHGADAKPKKKVSTRTFPAGSYVVSMAQPYSRIADALLDRQYWAPDDPQKHPYDDTGWSMGDQFGTEVVRVTDVAAIKAANAVQTQSIKAAGEVNGSGPIYAIDAASGSAIATLNYALDGAELSVVDAAFDLGKRHYKVGTVLVANASADALNQRVKELGLQAHSLAASPKVATHKLARPRIALMHTWLSTQTEGWWRMALDQLAIPYDYISTQDAARESNLRSRYDVILFGPVGYGDSQLIVDGLPMWGNPLPWQTTKLTPNLGTIDATDDVRPGLGQSGVANLKRFVEAGGLLVTASDTAKFAVELGFAPGVRMAATDDAGVVGSVLGAVRVDAGSPVAYGYGKRFALYSPDGMAFNISNVVRGGRFATADDYKRPTGRGGPHDDDAPQGRTDETAPELPSVKPWQAVPLNVDQARDNPFLIPEDLRPRVVVRYADADALLVSGLLKNGGVLAQRAAVVDARLGQGHVLLFANNPIWRGQTVGSYPLVLNAILNFDRLDTRAVKP